MSSNPEEQDDILKAALPSAFSQPVSLPSSVVDVSASSSVPPPVPIPTTLSSTASGLAPGEGSIDSSGWQEEYDSRVVEWRAQNAAQRQKAEETRDRFESIRAQEESEAAASGLAGRQPLPSFGTPGTEHVSVADARDLVSGERQATAASSPPISVSQPSETEHWEDVPSVASSFPSLPSHESQPSQPQHSTQPPSSVPSKEAVNTAAGAKPSTSQATTAPPATKSAVMAVTPKVLDKTLPVKTRAFALLSSLAINMFLPFVNGLMMGFGEIFARNVIAPWIGWQSSATAVGIKGAVKRPLDRLAAERDRLRSRKEDL